MQCVSGASERSGPPPAGGGQRADAGASRCALRLTTNSDRRRSATASVVSRAPSLKFEMRDGKPVLIKLPEVEIISSMTKKASLSASRATSVAARSLHSATPTAICKCCEWTTAESGARFALYVHHDDAEREWAYDRGSHIGKPSTRDGTKRSPKVGRS